MDLDELPHLISILQERALLSELARMAECSRATIYRALSTPERLSVENARKLLYAAKALCAKPRS